MGTLGDREDVDSMGTLGDREASEVFYSSWRRLSRYCWVVMSLVWRGDR